MPRTRLIRALIVEDFEPFRRFISSELRKVPGIEEVYEVSDGLEAVRKFQDLQPELVVLDIGLPTLDGIEVARRIRVKSHSTRLLFVSANRSPELVKAALDAGGDGYVLKTDAGRDLVPALELLLRGKRFISSSLADVVLTAELHVADEVQPAHPAGHRHEVVFCPDEVSLTIAFGRFIKAALDAGKAVIFNGTESHRAGVLRKLEIDGLDIVAALGQGRYIPLDVRDVLSTFITGDLVDPIRFSREAENLITRAAKAVHGVTRRVAACGECAPTLLAEGKLDAAIQLERLWDEVAETHGSDIFCAYLLEAENTAQAVESISAAHTSVQPC